MGSGKLPPAIGLVIMCDNTICFFRTLGQHNPFFFGVEVFVGFAVKFAAGDFLAFGVAETDIDFLRRISARRVECYFDSAFGGVGFVLDRHRAEICAAFSMPQVLPSASQ